MLVLNRSPSTPPPTKKFCLKIDHGSFNSCDFSSVWISISGLSILGQNLTPSHSQDVPCSQQLPSEMLEWKGWFLFFVFFFFLSKVVFPKTSWNVVKFGLLKTICLTRHDLKIPAFAFNCFLLGLLKITHLVLSVLDLLRQYDYSI